MPHDPAPDTHPTCPNHRTCDRLRELGYAGEGCPTVTDVARIAAMRQLDAEGVRRLMAG